jgi:hypothetical protein
MEALQVIGGCARCGTAQESLSGLPVLYLCTLAFRRSEHMHVWQAAGCAPLS